MANIQRYNPFSDFVSLREAMDRLFEESFISPRQTSLWAGRGVGSNLYETKEGFTLQVPMPGVKPEDVDITVQQDTISLKWETKFQQPENATTHGILTLNLPKAEHAKARTIKINAR
jgi:HSP20 family protein